MTNDSIWKLITERIRQGSIIGTLYGAPLRIYIKSETELTVGSKDSDGLKIISKQKIEQIYSKINQIRVELTNKTHQEILHVVSIIGYAETHLQRTHERAEIIIRAQRSELSDGVFLIVLYNEHTRIIGPQPAGETIELCEVFPTVDTEALSGLKITCHSLWHEANYLSELYWSKEAVNLKEFLLKKYPGFNDETYSSVLMRANYMAIK